MAEIPDAHKTDSQKTWAFRDIKLREVERKRKLQSPIPALSASAGFNGFPASGPCDSACRNRSSSRRFPQHRQMHVLRFRQLGRRPSQYRRRPVGQRRRLFDRLWRRRARPGRLPAFQRDLRTRGRGVLRGDRHRRQLAVADHLQQAWRHFLLPIANRMSSRTNAARRNIFPAARGCMPSTAHWARSTRTIWNGPSAASRPRSSTGDGRWRSRSPSRPRSAPSMG